MDWLRKYAYAFIIAAILFAIAYPWYRLSKEIDRGKLIELVLDSTIARHQATDSTYREGRLVLERRLVQSQSMVDELERDLEHRGATILALQAQVAPTIQQPDSVHVVTGEGEPDADDQTVQVAFRDSVEIGTGIVGFDAEVTVAVEDDVRYSDHFTARVSWFAIPNAEPLRVFVSCVDGSAILTILNPGDVAALEPRWDSAIDPRVCRPPARRAWWDRWWVGAAGVGVAVFLLGGVR